MISVPWLEEELWFPPACEALDDPNGLLAIGGGLSSQRLLLAYQNGIFPWYSEQEPILWWSPDPRGVLFVDHYVPSKSLQKHLRQSQWTITLNHQFHRVIEACACIPRDDRGTWITDEMQQAYLELHHLGHAHSVEVFQGEHLIGGLYGVLSNQVFCGESMFSRSSNASKVAFYYLVQHLKQQQIELIDCQMQNPHLKTLGCVEMPRTQFLETLFQQAKRTIPRPDFAPQVLHTGDQ